MPPDQRLSEAECSSLAAALVAEMRLWFAAGSREHELVAAFLEGDGCERAVLDMLLAVRAASSASRVPAALAAIRVNFGDALESFLKREESARDFEWRRACVTQHIQSWISAMPHVCRVWVYKLKSMYPALPPSWRRALLFTEEATFSVTHQASSQLICDKIMQRGAGAAAAVVDAFACVGGDTANFTRRFRLVHSIELDPVKIPLLRHNLRVCLNCTFRAEENAPPPSNTLPLPANLRVHVGDCRAVIPALELVRASAGLE